MRVGQNPNRINPADGFTDVVLTVITHLPHFSGYHQHRFDVIKACLETMRKYAPGYTVAVWDNGSHVRFLSWLVNEYKPDLFVSSPNVGNAAAKRALFGMFPDNTVVAYSDDDILFYPHWLEKQLEILRHFPNVSAVSGYPVRTAFRWGVINTLKRMSECGKIEKGRFILQEWEYDFAVSIGRDPKHHCEEYTKNDYDYLATYKGKKAYCTAHHCQVIGRAEVLRQARQLDGMAMGDEKPFDIKLDEMGNRLCTTERLARHMGNVLDDKLKRELGIGGK